MKKSIHLTKRQQKLLLAFILALILPLLGIGVSKKETVTTFVNTQNPGYYSVSEFLDGDTIVVNSGGKDEIVRMIGVDTPETHHPKKPVQCFGKAAADFTKNLIGNSAVRLEADPQDDNKDIYGRLLRYVYLPSGVLVNKEIVFQGYGFAYTVFPFTKLEEFRTAGNEARQAKRGLWGGCQIEDEGKTFSTNAE